MSKFFRVCAIVLFIVSILLLFPWILYITEPEGLWIFISAFSGGVISVALHTIGDLLDRVNYLEDKLDIHMPVEKSEDKLPQIKCKKCRTEYDMDYPRCPCCGTVNELIK